MVFQRSTCDWISILFNEASTVIDVNGNLSEPIRLQRSIRKGCPITPLIFFIAVYAMFYVLRDSKLGPPVKGIALPNMDELINVQFADDTSLFLGLTEENFDNSIRRLDFFCKASRSKIAPSKSTILGWQHDSPDWLVSKGWN